MSSLRYSESVTVACSPDALYDMVSDVTRMGEWSPVCTACWWDEGDGPRQGAWFTGRNELPERTWETRSQVVAADRGREFAFVVGGAWVRWGYTFTTVDGGTELTESWEFLPAGITRFHDRYGDDAEAQIANRTEAARNGIPATLAAIKKAAGRNIGLPGVVPPGMIKDGFAEFIAGQRQGVLVTLREDGRPQLSNVNYAWYPAEQTIKVSTTDDRAKTRNMRRDPRVSFHVTSGDFWSYVVVDGRAELSAVASDPHDAAVEELVDLYLAVQGEHPDWQDYRAAMVRDRRLVLRLRAERAYGSVRRS